MPVEWRWLGPFGPGWDRRPSALRIYAARFSPTRPGGFQAAWATGGRQQSDHGRPPDPKIADPRGGLRAGRHTLAATNFARELVEHGHHRFLHHLEPDPAGGWRLHIFAADDTVLTSWTSLPRGRAVQVIRLPSIPRNSCQGAFIWSRTTPILR